MPRRWSCRRRTVGASFGNRQRGDDRHAGPFADRSAKRRIASLARRSEDAVDLGRRRRRRRDCGNCRRRRRVLGQPGRQPPACGADRGGDHSSIDSSCRCRHCLGTGTGSSTSRGTGTSTRHRRHRDRHRRPRSRRAHRPPHRHHQSPPRRRHKRPRARPLPERASSPAKSHPRQQHRHHRLPSPPPPPPPPPRPRRARRRPRNCSKSPRQNSPTTSMIRRSAICGRSSSTFRVTRRRRSGVHGRRDSRKDRPRRRRDGGVCGIREPLRRRSASRGREAAPIGAARPAAAGRSRRHSSLQLLNEVARDYPGSPQVASGPADQAADRNRSARTCARSIR